MPQTILNRPRLHVGEAEANRRATWLELFYDLVYVATVIQIGDRLSDDVSINGFLGVVALFIPVWWSWVGTTFYSNRFDSDDAVHRLLVFTKIFFVSLMAINVYDALGETAPQFALGYAGRGQSERTEKGALEFTDTVLGTTIELDGSTTRNFVRDEQRKLVAQRTISSGGVARHYPLFDQLGSTVALTDSSGAVDARYVYEDPFGAHPAVSGAASTPLRFAGGYRDPETGFYKYGERYYMPDQGRWTQRDPLNQAFKPREANRYVYVGDDPVNLVDPQGLDWYELDIGLLSVGGDDEAGLFTVGLEANWGVAVGFSAGGSTGVAETGLSAEAEGCFFGCLGVSTDTGLGYGLGFNWSADVGVEWTFAL